MIGFIGIEIYTYHYNSHMYICSLDSKEDDYSLTIEQVKIWNEDAHGYNYGIQYDAYIYDNTNKDIKNWKAYITIPADCKLDSYWNGEFILQDGVLDNIENFDVHFYKSIDRENVSFFWVLVLLAVLYIFIIITKIIIEIKTRKITEQKEEYVNIVNQSFLTFANMIDAKDPYTKGHSQRVAIYCK